MLAALPKPILIAILACLGACIGATINLAIYSWAMFQDRRISPWMRPLDGQPARKPLDRVPIIGWIGMRRDASVHGKRFWIRPMLVELVWAACLPWFCLWLQNGGLIGMAAISTPDIWIDTWFAGFTCLFALMCIGTFIDFDEKTIPDEVTVTGTILALLLAAMAPWFRLPETVFLKANREIDLIHSASPHDMGNLHQSSWGLPIAMLIFAFWIWALMPKLPVWYVGFRKSCRFMFAHAVQPKRKKHCDLRTKPRSTPIITIVLASLLVLGLVGIASARWLLPTSHWSSLFDALIGMAFGGGLIWAIRIVGTYAMQKEAMGFGDVTLMAMIGAFLGWQAALLVFVIAPFAALAVVAIQFATSRDSMIAFGPYLCAAAAALIFQWHWIWPAASAGIFALGPVLLYILIAALVLMVVMLVGIQWLKGLFGQEGDLQ